jgi:predicted enzyme related to lactoylglutathione lyase
MITGVHALMYSKDADATRAFFRDVLRLGSVDGGRGWLIFALPPAELGIHPADDDTGTRAELYLMCDDVERTVTELKVAGVETTRPIADQGWGLVTALRVPGGIEVGLYQPRHPTALHLSGDKAIQRSAS